MSGRDGRIIRSCGEIAPGAEIEAWRQGRLIHRGRVSETVPSMGMFWIIDARNGTRELLDADALEVIEFDSAADGWVHRGGKARRDTGSPSLRLTGRAKTQL